MAMVMTHGNEVMWMMVDEANPREGDLSPDARVPVHTHAYEEAKSTQKGKPRHGMIREKLRKGAGEGKEENRMMNLQLR